MNICVHEYKLQINGRGRKYKCCDIKYGFMLKHWRCINLDGECKDFEAKEQT
jgi:hypothetical protein